MGLTSLRERAALLARPPVGLLQRLRSRGAVPVLAFAAAMLTGTVETENAVANGDTRTLSLIHEHTKETATVTFKRDGRYDRAALDQLNWLLRDWREAEATKMDPRLFDVVWEAQRSIGSSEPLRVVCGYRSPKTNGMLRRRSRGVAEHSQHMLGKAMDFFMTDASVDDIRSAGVRLQRGGVGWYPRSGSPFVHLDVGSVRAWPRMTRDQLATIFPDGKTVHLPADGKPFPRYEEARAEILARGGTVLGVTAVASADETDDGPSIKGFFAGLFGGGGASPPSEQAAKAGKARDKTSIAVASADPDDATGVRQALAFAAPASSETLREAMLRRQGREAPSAKSLLTGAGEPATGAPETVAVVAPLPPRRPAEFAAIAAAIAAPLPPARPVKVAGIGDAGLSGMALGGPAATAAPARLLPAEADGRDHLRSLFSAQAQGASEPARRDAPVRLAVIQARADAAPEDIFSVDTVATRFSARSPGENLAASRFSGSALAPPLD